MAGPRWSPVEPKSYGAVTAQEPAVMRSPPPVGLLPMRSIQRTGAG
jgi:hypothetical protein